MEKLEKSASTKMSPTLVEALNDQMNYEFYSSHVYLAMASYCESQDYNGFAKFFLEHAEEERAHGMKIYKYLHDRGEQAIITGFGNPNNEYESVLDACEKALEHEKVVTSRFYTLSDIADSEKEYTTTTFLKWFLQEQVEEESLFETVVQKLRRIKDDETALFIYDMHISHGENAE
jgi:ferritin